MYDFPVRVGPTPNYATCGGAPYPPRLNARDPEVERFVTEVALHWLERGIDGWRLDVPFEIHTAFWRRFRNAVKSDIPEACLVGEEWRDPRGLCSLQRPQHSPVGGSLEALSSPGSASTWRYSLRTPPSRGHGTSATDRPSRPPDRIRGRRRA